MSHKKCVLFGKRKWGRVTRGWGESSLWLSPLGFSHSDPGSLSMDLCPKAWEMTRRMVRGRTTGSLGKKLGKRRDECPLLSVWCLSRGRLSLWCFQNSKCMPSVIEPSLIELLLCTRVCAGNGNTSGNLAQVSTIPYASMQGALFLLSHLIFAVLQVIFAVLSHVLEIYNVLFPSH